MYLLIWGHKIFLNTKEIYPLLNNYYKTVKILFKKKDNKMAKGMDKKKDSKGKPKKSIKEKKAAKKEKKNK